MQRGKAEIVFETPSGSAPALTIRYYLPAKGGSGATIVAQLWTPEASFQYRILVALNSAEGFAGRLVLSPSLRSSCSSSASGSIGARPD